MSDVQSAWADTTRMLMLASPSNPTGNILPTATLASIVRFIAAKGGKLVVDEIYHGLHYGNDITTALTFSDDLYVVNSFSKYFSMTGWRLGWLVVPEDDVEWFERLAQNVYLSAPTLAQYAALVAFLPETIALLSNRKSQFQKRRDFLLPALRNLGFEIPETPQGAFYLYAKSTAFTSESFSWCLRLLNEAGVAITPGIDFSCQQAEQYVRFAYTTSMAQLEEGVERIRRFV